MPRIKSNLSALSREAKRKRLKRSLESLHEDPMTQASETYIPSSANLSANKESDYSASETFTPNSAGLSTNRDEDAILLISQTFTPDLSENRDEDTISRTSQIFTPSTALLAAITCEDIVAQASDTFTPSSTRLSASEGEDTMSQIFTPNDYSASETFTPNSAGLSTNRDEDAILLISQTFTPNLSENRDEDTISRTSQIFTPSTVLLAAITCKDIVSQASDTFTPSSTRLSANEGEDTMSQTFTPNDYSASETFTPNSAGLSTNMDENAILLISQTFTPNLSENRDEDTISRTSQIFTPSTALLPAITYEDTVSQASDTFTPSSTRVSANEGEDTMSQTFTPNSAPLFASNDEYSMSQISRLSLENSMTTQTFTPDSAHVTEDRQNLSQLQWDQIENSGFAYSPNINYQAFASFGRMEHVCQHCLALKWRKESVGFCCSSGKVRFDLFSNPPELIKLLLNGEHPLSQHFLDNIRTYNAAFQMTSFGAKQVVHGTFMPTFKVQGQVYHLIGSLLPEENPKYLQTYFVSDYQEQAYIRSQHFTNLNVGLLFDIQEMLHLFNRHISNFKAALESIPPDQQDQYKFIISPDKRPPTQHRGRYNAPSTNEVAVVLVDQQCDKRDIVLRARDNSLHRISETHRSYDSLQYPLIYCHGEDGYNFGIRQIDPTTGAIRDDKKATALQFYCYLLQVRQNRFAYLQRFRGLFSQFIVDMYAKIETERLVYIRTHQTQLRAENYTDLHDAMENDTNPEDMGRLVILPSTFTGSPRNMHEQVQDALSYVRKYGKPDLFITATTNPKWDEITQELIPGQVPYDRHDLISRVFHLKLKLLINLLTKEKVFGASLCFTYNIEWQKRGLPHAHILLWLQEKIRPQDVDNVISAEIPNPNTDPVLHAIVKQHMIHGPCGALNYNSPCMQDGRCTKKFPKNLIQETITGDDGYPKYRRRAPDQGGFTAMIRLMEIDNRWVVPFSPVLSKTFQGHVNVEMCNSIKSIKYIFKYVNKGTDQATLATSNDRDEVTRFQTGRYISSSEAAWRIFSFPIFERFPPVIHLDVHVEGGQRIYFNTNNVMERLENPRQTTLMAFFTLCESDDFAKTLLYNEVPEYYTYNKQQRRFVRRRRGTPVAEFPDVMREHVIGRVYTVHPNNAECFYVRLLLHNVRGPISFPNLKTFNGIEYPTFQAACRARGLLDDDQHWDETLAEASLGDSPHRLRHLFAVMLVFCGISDANQLWLRYQHNLAEDYLRTSPEPDHELHDRMRNTNLNRCLCKLQEIVTSIGGHALSYYGLPEPLMDETNGTREYATEINYNFRELAATLEEVSNLTSEQKAIFDQIHRSVLNETGGLYFLDAPGGTGKTYLTKLILAQVRIQNKIALAVASSGIAATLLPGGKTAHSMLKIPIQLDICETPVCDISRNSEKAKLLRDAVLIVWDECTMAHRKAIEAVNRTLKDIRQNDQLMGGITMLFCGDFRQTLPVVTRGMRADEVNACLKSSNLWPFVRKINLTTNIRAQMGGNENAQQFSDLLLSIGEGRYPVVEGKITLTNELCHLLNSLQDVISSVYGDPAEIINQDNSWLCERAILTPRNDQATTINSNIMDRVEGQIHVYTSVNRVIDQEEATTYPIEFLNSLSASGLPAHEIKLKIGVPIILMRNLSPPKLCNGTRLKVVALQRNVIEAEILTGCGKGERVFIPRIPLIPSNYPFKFKRIQLPISLAFAMTINKAQGQTLRKAGIDLTSSCFSHGQLYVALSRVSDAADVFVYASDNKTSNIVYQEVLY